MKLYAAVTSERASKGQGGNEWLECIMGIDKDMNKQVRLYTDGNTFRLYGGGDGSKLLYDSEACAACKEPMHGMIRVHHHTEGGVDVTKDGVCADGQPHRYDHNGECTGEDCYKIKGEKEKGKKQKGLWL
jgi:hypothetical protein